jgi:riboflavin kinase/FMN adenylyltransferase
MQVHHGIQHLPAFKHVVLTTGMFDGVHVAHQRLLQKINNRAKEQESESVLITFWPHPQMVLGSNDRSPIQLLNTLEEKIANLEKTGLDHLVILPFDTAFASMSAEDYIEKFLVANFHPQTIVIGFNHRFGNQRKGDVHLLQTMGMQHDFTVMEFDQQI